MIGTGLAGLIAAHSGANEIVISDFPNSEILGAIKENVEENICKEVQKHVTVQAHEWGDLEDDFSKAHANHFTRILSADCLWMAGEHLNLARSMLHFLAHGNSARVWVTAGFHTGRSIVAQFFDVAVDAGLAIEKIWEQDVHGNKRIWTRRPASNTENATDLKRWLVIAILRRNSDQ